MGMINLMILLRKYLGGGGKYKLYGVRFDPTVGNPGARTYDAQNLLFAPSTLTYKGADDFINLENGKSPFGIKECATKYNPSTGKQEIMTYKGESDWESAIADPEHNRMIEFPKFYYKRPSRMEFVVSKDPFPGSSPSPMHYRNGVLYDKWYVSKYIVEATTGLSQSDNGGAAVAGRSYVNTFLGFRNNLIEKGLYMLDFATYCTVHMLAFIKYATGNIYSYISTQRGNANLGSCDNVLGMDGRDTDRGNSNGLIFGLENFAAGVSYKTYVVGVTGYDYINPGHNDSTSIVAINTDIDTISRINDGSDVDNMIGYTQLEQHSVQPNNVKARIAYSPDCDWAFYSGALSPSDDDDTKDSTIFYGLKSVYTSSPPKTKNYCKVEYNSNGFGFSVYGDSGTADTACFSQCHL